MGRIRKQFSLSFDEDVFNKAREMLEPMPISQALEILMKMIIKSEQLGFKKAVESVLTKALKGYKVEKKR
jgi:antitoxin component of RelBE/YafQ-DinJ toxin-antitoxin module